MHYYYIRIATNLYNKNSEIIYTEKFNFADIKQL